MVRIPSDPTGISFAGRIPTHPGEMLLTEFLEPMKITENQLAEALFLPIEKIKEIVNKKRAIDPSIALRLAKFFGMSPDFWLNLQLRWDLYYAQQNDANQLAKIQQYQLLK